jgi:hypothetical protein
MSPPTTSLETVEESNDDEETSTNNTCTISINNKGNIARNLLESMPVDSPINHPKKRKNTLDEEDSSLTSGWLEDIFSHPRETQSGFVHLMNWRFRNINQEDILCAMFK